jgi:hypothetical protein
MRWLRQNVSASATNRGTNSAESVETAEVVRRTEITVDRRVCTVEIHGSVDLGNLENCPVCGQSLPAPHAGSALTPGTENETE